MARGVFSIANYLKIDSGIITATPLTIAARVYPTAVTSHQFIAGLYYTSAGIGTAHDGWAFRIAITTGNIEAICGNGVTNATAVSASGVTTNAWNHIVAKFVSSTSRYAYLNGVAGSQNTGNIAPSANPDKTAIGVQIREDGSLNQAATASRIAEVGFWNTDLTDAEIAALAKGVSPLLIRFQNLVAYYPLIRGDSSGDEPNPKDAAYKMTEQGTISVQPHPPVFMPRPPSLFKRATAAPTGWSNILKANGLLTSDLSSGVFGDLDSIAKVNGVAV